MHASRWTLKTLAFASGLFLASAGTVAAQSSVAFPGSTALGQTSLPVTVTVTIAASGIAVAPLVFTQGIAGKDFNAASATCAAGTAYTAGQSCTVSVAFSPKFPGQRLGALVLKSQSGTVLGTSYLSGLGTGPLAVLSPGQMTTVAGDASWIYNGDGLKATSTPIFLPGGITLDAAGNMFISDTDNNRIRRVDASTGLVSTVAGNGSPGFGGDGGLAFQANISTPGTIIIDGAGNLLFADTGNNVIRRVDVVTGIISTVAGVGGVQGYTGDNGPATQARLSLPQGLVLDAANNLYIADTGNNVVRRVDAVTGTITTIAGTGVGNYNNASGLPATSTQLLSPWNVRFGKDGLLYIVDSGNNLVRKITAAGLIVTAAGNGGRSFSGDGGTAVAAALFAPSDVVFDPAGNMYIADSGNNRLRMVDINGNIATISGTNDESFYGDGDPADLATMYGPSALFFSQDGNLYFADMFHNRIRAIMGTQISLSYLTMRVSKTSAPQPIGLVNDGNDTLNLTAPTLVQAALDPATTTCATGSAITAGDLCNLGVEFAPTVIGAAVSGSLTVNSNATNGPPFIGLSGQVLSVEPTTTTLVSSANPSQFGSPVTLTAAVSGATPTGTVTFLDGSATLCSVTLTPSGSAICTTSTLTLGSHNLKASYAGDASNASSVSPVVVQVVKQTSTLVLAVTPNPSVVTGSIAFTAAVSAPTGTPTGTVLFYDGTTPIGSGTLTSGIASFTTNALTADTHSLSAQYNGDATNVASTSNIITEIVQKATTTSTIGTSNASSTVGAAVIFTASVTSTNGPTPTGSVSFSDGLTALGKGTLGANGVATFSTTTLAPGAHAIIATYSGDDDSSQSASSPLTQNIQQIATTTTVDSDANPAQAGATVHLTAKVAMVQGAVADGSITGTVTFTDGANTIGAATLSSGAATLTTTSLPSGAHLILASYGGNTNYATSASTTLTQSITQTGTTTTLSSSNPTNALAGKSVVLTATVASGTGIPTGAVTFMDGTANLGQGTLSAKGVATLSLLTLTVGNHSITAVYAGDGNYTTSTSASVAQTISLATTSLTIAGPVSPISAGLSITINGALTGNGVIPTGQLNLLDNGAVIASATVTSNGVYSFTNAALSVGSHALTVSYGGDPDNATATSSTLTLVLQQGATTTALSSSINPQVVNASITLSATVTSPSPNITGTITFMDGTVNLGSVAVSTKGAGTLTITSLAFGAHNLTAVYSGDVDHAASTSPVVIEQIVEPAMAALASSVNPAVAGANIIFTAKISGVNNIIPTGAVTFSDGSTSLGTVTLDPTGAASLQIATLAVASHTIKASYAGDTNYSAASASLTETVKDAGTQITLTSAANPATYGTSLAVTATITSNGSIPTGSVSFTDGGLAVGSALLDPNGVGILTLSTLTPGTHTIVASYTSDGRAASSVSTPLTLIVKQITTVALASSLNPASTLSAVTLTATVTNAGVGFATGVVTFTDGATTLGTGTLSAAGVAAITVPQFTSGNHTLAAAYAGDGSDFNSASPALTQSIALRPTTTTLTASQSNPNNALEVTLIGVVRFTGPQTPTGAITFTQGSKTLGSATVDSTGVGTLIIVLQSSTESITAVYSGDTAYSTSTSQPTTITGGKGSQLTLALDPASVTMASSAHTTVNLTLSSTQGFADTLQLGCAGLPFSATCTFSTTSATLAAGGTQTVKIVVDTGNPLGAGTSTAQNRSTSTVLLSFLPIGLLAGFGFVRRKRISMPALLLLLCALVTTLGVTGCGGLQVNGTPAGNYTFSVTAAGQNTGVTGAAVMTLTVTK